MKTAARMLLGQQVIAFNPLLADIAGDVKGGLFLSQLCYWSERTNDQKGWFYKTTAQWYEETRLTRRELETVRKVLNDLKVIELSLRGVPAKCHYRVNWERLEMLILDKNCNKNASLHENAKLDCTKTPNKFAQKRQTSTAENAKQVCTNQPNKFGAKRQTITETTTENKTKNKQDISFSAEKDSSEVMPKAEAKATFSALAASLAKGRPITPQNHAP